jgi:hypothetical protein
MARAADGLLAGKEERRAAGVALIPLHVAEEEKRGSMSRTPSKRVPEEFALVGRRVAKTGVFCEARGPDGREEALRRPIWARTAAPLMP